MNNYKLITLLTLIMIVTSNLVYAIGVPGNTSSSIGRLDCFHQEFIKDVNQDGEITYTYLKTHRYPSSLQGEYCPPFDESYAIPLYEVRNTMGVNWSVASPYTENEFECLSVAPFIGCPKKYNPTSHDCRVGR